MLALLAALLPLASGERLAAHTAYDAPRERRRRFSAGLVLLGAAARGRGAAGGVVTFDVADKDDDGVLDKEEYMMLTRDMVDESGIADPERRRRVFNFAERLFDAADIDSDGLLEPRELEYQDFLLSEIFPGMKSSDPALFQILSQAQPSLPDPSFLFTMVDQNRDTMVDFGEFWQAAKDDFNAMGWKEDFDAPSVQSWLRDIFKGADINGDGWFNADELKFACFRMFGHVDEELARQIMKDLDTNKDGKIDRQEVKKGATRTGWWGPGPQNIRALLCDKFDSADFDEDGMLDEMEARVLAAEIVSGMNG